VKKDLEKLNNTGKIKIILLRQNIIEIEFLSCLLASSSLTNIDIFAPLVQYLIDFLHMFTTQRMEKVHYKYYNHDIQKYRYVFPIRVQFFTI